jgi:hypothetical protein
MRAAICSLLFVFLTALPCLAEHTPTALIRGRDISVRYLVQDTCRWIDGHTATQAQRGAMFLSGATRFLPVAVRIARTVPACSGYQSSWTSRLSDMNRRLRSYYVDRCRDREWSIVSGGCPDYSKVADTGRDLQACCTRNAKSAAACAASPDLTSDILEWADLRIEAGKTVVGAAYTLTIPTVEDKTVAMQGHLEYNKPLPPLTTQQMDLWQKALMLHHESDDAVCSGAPPVTGVKNALLAFIDSAVDERQKHFFGIAEFEGSMDPTWSPQDRCDIKKLEGFAMNEIDRCFHPTGKDMWACLTRARASHESWHVIGAVNAGELRIGNHSDCKPQLTSTLPRTPREWIDCQVGTVPGCRLPWVPDPNTWRVLVH